MSELKLEDVREKSSVVIISSKFVPDQFILDLYSRYGGKCLLLNHRGNIKFTHFKDDPKFKQRRLTKTGLVTEGVVNKFITDPANTDIFIINNFTDVTLVKKNRDVKIAVELPLWGLTIASYMLDFRKLTYVSPDIDWTERDEGDKLMEVHTTGELSYSAHVSYKCCIFKTNIINEEASEQMFLQRPGFKTLDIASYKPRET